MKPGDANPFELLRLDPTTPSEEIVRAAAFLRQRATDDASIAAIRQAVQAITTSTEERRLCELLTHAKPRYDWPALGEFVAAFRRPPLGAVPQQETEQVLRALLFDIDQQCTP
jgi:hypothetical protein